MRFPCGTYENNFLVSLVNGSYPSETPYLQASAVEAVAAGPRLTEQGGSIAGRGGNTDEFPVTMRAGHVL